MSNFSEGELAALQKLNVNLLCCVLEKLFRKFYELLTIFEESCKVNKVGLVKSLAIGLLLTFSLDVLRPDHLSHLKI